MKILITGSAQHWALEGVYAKYLRELGAEVTIFPSADKLENYQRASLINKVLFRSGVSGVLKTINQELIDFVNDTTPDIVWVFKGVEILPGTLKKLANTLLVNYNPDHPFIRSFSSNGGKNIEACLPLYHLNLCYNRELSVQIQAMFGKLVHWLPFGYNLSKEEYKICSLEQDNGSVCFAGNPDAQRAALVTKIAAHASIDVYGHGWEKFLSSGRNIQVKDAVYGIEFWKVLHRYRVQLNVFRPHNLGSHNMRTFEVPAAGGIMLAPDSPEHRNFFKAEEEVFLYTDTNSCIQQVAVLLEKSPAETSRIRLQARARSVDSNYSYQDRAAEVYHLFKHMG